MPEGYVVKAPFNFTISNERYSGTKILRQIPLLVCDEDDAPEYNDSDSKGFKVLH